MVNPLGSQTRPCYTCPICRLVCKTGGGLTRHQQTVHREFTPASENGAADPLFHPLLNGTVSHQFLTCPDSFLLLKLSHATRMVIIYLGTRHHHLPMILGALLFLGSLLLRGLSMMSPTTTLRKTRARPLTLIRLLIYGWQA